MQSEEGRSRLDKALARADRFQTAIVEEERKRPRGGETAAAATAGVSSASASSSAPAHTPQHFRIDADDEPSLPAAAAPPQPATQASGMKRQAEDDAAFDDRLGPAETPSSSSAPAAAPPQPAVGGTKRQAEDNAAFDDRLGPETPGASSSSAPPPAATGTKRAPATSTERLDDDAADGMSDIMSLHVGPAFALDPQGSVSEIYSPPRIAPRAEARGFAPGWSLDLTTSGPDGAPWDFSKHECREKARQLIRKSRPLLLVGSPMCTWFSILQNLNKGKVDPAEWQKGYDQAVEHIKFVFELYDMQVRGGRYLSLIHI